MADDVHITFGADIGGAQESMGILTGSITQMREVLQGLVRPLYAVRENLGGLAEAFAAFAIAQKVKEVVTAAVELVHLSETIGITTTQLQDLQFAGGEFGVSAETMNAALIRFASNLGEAAHQAGPLYEILKANHVLISGNLLTDFKNYANLVQNTADSEQRGILIRTAFGRTAAEMGNLFRDGAAGVQDLIDQADKLGVALDPELLKKTEGIERQFKSFIAVLTTDFKTAVLSAVGVTDTLSTEFNTISTSLNDLIANPSWARFRELMLGSGPGVDKIFGTSGGVDRPSGETAKTVGQLAEMLGNPPIESGPQTKLPPPAKHGGKGPFASALETSDKQIAALNAQAAAFGMTKGAAAAYEEEIKLETIAHQAFGANIDKVLPKIKDLATRFGDATMKLEALKAKQQEWEFVASGINGAVSSWLQGTASLGQAFVQLADQIALAVIQALIFNSIMRLFGLPLGGGGGGPFGSLFAGIFGGKRAGGGGVDAGKLYVVGERGPELFAPGASGSIIPNSGISGGSDAGGGQSLQVGALHVHNYGPGPMSPRQITDALFRAIRDGHLDIGKLAFGR